MRGLLEPCAVRVACTVLRGGEYGDVLSLPDHSRLGYLTPHAFKAAWVQAQANGQDPNIGT